MAPRAAASVPRRTHREYGKWPPERVVAWAESVGVHVGELAQRLMSRRTHPEKGYRACLGVIRLADRFGRERVDAACARAVSIGSPTFKTLQAILKNGLDRTPLFEPPPRTALEHDNIRGPSYFDNEVDNAQRGNGPEAAPHEVARWQRCRVRWRRLHPRVSSRTRATVGGYVPTLFSDRTTPAILCTDGAAAAVRLGAFGAAGSRFFFGVGVRFVPLFATGLPSLLDQWLDATGCVCSGKGASQAKRRA
ncbi:MAG TPA: hypothetical protein VEK07_18040 [Polyangiaceae bacterium]|nr:hypothetical protein [Polyangiaceae bacterium]